MSPKILFNSWSGAFFKPGGGEMQLNFSERELRKCGLSIEHFNMWEPQRDIDILHQFSIEEGVEHVVRAYKSLGKKIVISPILWHDFTSSSPNYSRISGLLHSADLIFTNSEAESKKLQQQFKLPIDRFHKTRNSITDNYFTKGDPTTFRQRFDIKEDFVLSVANIDTRKNTQSLVRACKELNLQLYTIGHIRDENYFCEFKESYTRWKHLGPIDDVELLKSAYSACRVYALPSLCETPGLAALEAASQEARVVITTEGPTKEYFGDDVVYVNPRDYGSIVRGLSEAWDTHVRVSGLSEKIIEQFRWALTAKDILAGYNKILELDKKR